MRIDPAVCHKILVAIEGDPNSGSGQFLRIEVEGYEPPLSRTTSSTCGIQRFLSGGMSQICNRDIRRSWFRT